MNGQDAIEANFYFLRSYSPHIERDRWYLCVLMVVGSTHQMTGNFQLGPTP